MATCAVCGVVAKRDVGPCPSCGSELGSAPTEPSTDERIKAKLQALAEKRRRRAQHVKWLLAAGFTLHILALAVAAVDGFDPGTLFLIVSLVAAAVSVGFAGSVGAVRRWGTGQEMFDLMAVGRLNPVTQIGGSAGASASVGGFAVFFSFMAAGWNPIALVAMVGDILVLIGAVRTGGLNEGVDALNTF